MDWSGQSQDKPPWNQGGRDTDVMKVILFACVVIASSILLVGALVYHITERAAVTKLKSQDLAHLASSISAQVDGRIARAEETAKILAKDPEMLQWAKEGEKDFTLQAHVLQRLAGLTRGTDYNNSFVINSITRNYWTEEGKMIDTLSPTDPDDDWFFATLAAQEPVSVVIDYNDERKDTFVFVNALLGDPTRPLGITGVGMSLMGLSRDFQSFKYGKNSDLWLIDSQGNIYLSDDPLHNGRHIRDFLPSQVTEKFLGNGADTTTLEYQNQLGEVVDLIRYPLKTANWYILFQIPRGETVSYLKTIQYNTLWGTLLALVSITFLFIFVSRNLANPYKRALALNEQLEEQVTLRTQELNQKNQKLMDSIDYAQRIQQAIVPTEEKLANLFKDYFLLWQPRDVVGGDFYWSKSVGQGYLVAVGDCTGHGVPGALMTMLTVSILNQLVGEQDQADPAQILQQLNIRIKETLNQQGQGDLTNDGLDLGLCYYDGAASLFFAGAKCSLYVNGPAGIERVAGNKKSVGYVKTPADYSYSNQLVTVQEGQRFYLTTDGFLDQNGGPKNYSFGKKRFVELIDRYGQLPLVQQGQHFQRELEHYRGAEAQRDDITVLAFQIR